ncbi:hypothetical protein FRC07_008993 [Ceratobasidium sp. 392]|nr:hypothetical protein FRC07_008993 [Ceratobasidium sp. 392]
MQSNTAIPFPSPFDSTSNATPLPDVVETTIESFVQVTATQVAIATQDGRVVTMNPSDVFSSAVVYTTIIVEKGGEKGAPPRNTSIIIGFLLGVLFLFTLPIIVWLILRYRRRPIPASQDDTPDEPHHLPGSKSAAGLSTLSLLESDEIMLATSGGSPTSRQFWITVGDEKRPITVPQHPRRNFSSNFSPNDSDPFDDPVVPLNAPCRPKNLPRLYIPNNPAHRRISSSPSVVVLGETTPASGNTSIVPKYPNYSTEDFPSRSAPRLGVSYIQEKIAQIRRQDSIPTPVQRVPSTGEVPARIFVPGRAVDMGPLGRAPVGDVDENGLLPPNYSQATQPV